MNLPAPPPAAPVSSADKLLAILCHLSLIFGMAFLLPLIVYLVKRGESPFVAAHAREALNFHLSLIIYGVCLIPLFFILIGFPLGIALALMAFICSIIAAVKASESAYYFYPLTLRLIS